MFVFAYYFNLYNRALDMHKALWDSGAASAKKYGSSAQETHSSYIWVGRGLLLGDRLFHNQSKLRKARAHVNVWLSVALEPNKWCSNMTFLADTDIQYSSYLSYQFDRYKYRLLLSDPI